MARKKRFKQAEYKSFPNCFDRSSEQKGKWSAFFGNENPICLELGCGKAEFSLKLAQKYSDVNYIGVDLKPDRMWYAAKQAVELNMSNIAFLHIHLLELGEYFGENEVAEIWITFPDPFPKNRQAKHRMINPQFLRIYEQICQPSSTFHFKTDNLPLFQWGLETLVSEPNVYLNQLSFDLHEDERIAADAKIKTDYERKFMEMGMKINYVNWRKEL